MMRFLRSKKGFTLVELMIVVAIIGILAGIAIPRYMNFVRRSREGATKGNLGAIRSALNIYYSDQEGVFPATLNSSPFIGTGASNYLDELKPANEDCVNGAHKNVTTVVNQVTYTVAPTDVGGWQYNTIASYSTSAAKVFVNCVNKDTKDYDISSW